MAKKTKKESFFWTSYSDLMTSLFFIMLVLFVLAIVVIKTTDSSEDKLRKEIVQLKEELEKAKKDLKSFSDTLRVTELQLKKIEEIQEATKKIDTTYFKYDNQYKRHTIKDIVVSFETESSNIYDISDIDREKLLSAGREIQKTMRDAQEAVPEAQYMLIIEGQSSRDNYAYNYELSYKRALSLVKYWFSRSIYFDSRSNITNCEVIISGSGIDSPFRDEIERNNQRFVIHILPKPGEIRK